MLEAQSNLKFNHQNKVLKKSVFILCLFYSVWLCGQNKIQGRITYKVHLEQVDLNQSFTKEKDLSPEVRAKMKAMLKNTNSINYLLKFTNNESFSSKESTMKKQNMIDISVGKGVYYTNKISKEVLHQTESFGEVFIIQKPKMDWTLTQEKKKIGNYLCFKATSEIIVEGRSGKKPKQIIAWYTTEIPMGFGPKGYGDLPGLILVLHEGNLTFSASKIELNFKEELQIKKPTKGKKVTMEEHNKLMKKMFSEFRN